MQAKRSPLKIIVEIGHPGHVHLFRYVIQELRTHGHEVKIVARDKDVTIQLLNDYNLEYTSLSRQSKGMAGLFLEMLQRDWKLLRIARAFNPDIFLSLSMCSAQIAALLGKVSIIMDDSEHAVLERAAWLPFTTVVLTSVSYNPALGRNQVRYKGFHELAYLHPNRYKPNPAVLSEVGIREGDPYYIVRFVSWAATHDAGQSGFSYDGKKQLVNELAKLGRVIITSESPLPPEFEPYRMPVSPTKIHDLLNYCSLYIGEGATMASEAVMLGIPSIYVNSLSAGTLEEQEHKYHLLHSITDEHKAIETALEIAKNPHAREEYQQKRQQLLADKIDVTAWLVDFIENYPL